MQTMQRRSGSAGVECPGLVLHLDANGTKAISQAVRFECLASVPSRPCAALRCLQQYHHAVQFEYYARAVSIDAMVDHDF
jgi:hypothetical protein